MVDHRKTSYAPDTSLADVKSQLALCTPKTRVTYVQSSEIAATAIDAQDALTQTLARLSDITADKADTRTMTEPSDYRHELALRDEQLKREMDIRHENARQEQAERQKALDNQLAGFYAVQAERDKRIDDAVADIKSEITKLGSLKLNIWGAMVTAIGILVAIAALSLTFYQTGKTDSQAQANPNPTSAQSATSSSSASKP